MPSVPEPKEIWGLLDEFASGHLPRSRAGVLHIEYAASRLIADGLELAIA
jgi:hypothetical protein